MKVVCAVENLRAAVSTTERFTGRHITLPILSHIFFSAKERKISIAATNLEVGVEYTLPGKVQKPGAVTIPARSFSQILQSLPNEPATLEAKQNQFILHTSSNDVTLLGLNPQDFPTLPEIKKESSFVISSPELTKALEQVLPAAATTELKPELAGVLVKTQGGSLIMAATDSFRLSEKALIKSVPTDEKFECIVPAKTFQEVLRTISSLADTEVLIYTGEHQIVFECEGIKMVSRLVDGTYPPYKNLIPKNYETTILVNRADFAKKVKLAAVLSSRLNDVTLNFTSTQLEVKTHNADTGGTVARLAVKGRGKEGEVMFNHRYLADGAEAASGESIVINLNGASGPAMIQSPDDPSFLYLVMPIRSA